jgi:F-type H+-transporting ATPase subunit gamma
MSDTAATLRKRLHGATELRSVVRTMKSVAASSIGQYERSILALADYYRTVELGLGACLRMREPAAAGGQGPARPGLVGAVVFGSDQGLVGQFNDIVADDAVTALTAIGGKPRVWAVGERVRARLAERGFTPTRLFAVPTSVAGIAPLVGQILLQTEAVKERIEVTELHLFYNCSRPGSTFEPARERLLPLDEQWYRERAAVPWPTKSPPEMIGGDVATLRRLVQGYLFVSIFRASAESLASENASRLAAMGRAEKNIDETLENLKSSFHRVRQASIDEELFDVVAGFEALFTTKKHPPDCARAEQQVQKSGALK